VKRKYQETGLFFQIPIVTGTIPSEKESKIPGNTHSYD